MLGHSVTGDGLSAAGLSLIGVLFSRFRTGRRGNRV